MLGGGSLRAGPLYMAVSFMFLLAYNGVGCVFEGVSRFSEFYVASTRIQVRSVACIYTPFCMRK